MRQIVEKLEDVYFVEINDFEPDEEKIYCFASSEFWKICRMDSYDYFPVCLTDSRKHWGGISYTTIKSVIKRLIDEGESIYEFDSLREATDWFYSQAK